MMRSFILSVSILLTTIAGYSQIDEYTTATQFDSTKVYVIIKHDGTEFIGNIIENNAHELLINTINRGLVYIPQHEIDDIRLIENPGDIKDGEYVGEEIFSTRYFLTTNAQPIKRGDSYAMINIYGPEIHYGATDKFSIGLMTSWGAIPIIAAAKLNLVEKEGVNLGLGLLAGTGSWALPDYFGALPFASLTLGNKNKNINFSGGYGVLGDGVSSDGTGLFSISGLSKMGKKTSFVFDSFIVANQNYNGALIIPGLRFQKKSDVAFQFGFAGIIADGEAVPVPIPFVGWFIKL